MNPATKGRKLSEWALWLLIAVLLLGWPSPSWAEEQGIRVLAYNIRVDFDGSSWNRRLPTVRRILRDSNADIIAIQEASELMIADYAAALPEYHYRIGERSDGHRGTQRWYEFNPVFYRADRFELLDTGSHWIGENPELPGDTIKDSKNHGRVLHWVRLGDRRTGSAFTLANIHIHGQNAERALRVIYRILRQKVASGPIILAGDFNVTPDKPAYRALVNDLGFVDLGRELSAEAPTVLAVGDAVPSGIGGKKIGRNPRRIDYVFGTKEITAKRYEILNSQIEPGLFASDHFPILATLSVPRAGDRIVALKSDFMRAQGPVTVVAHRGCWSDAPENSIPAIKNCIANGIPMVELDVRQLADGSLVLMHDESVDRTTGGQGSVSMMPLEQFQRLRLRMGAGGDRPLTREVAPTLKEALETARGRVLVNLDIKDTKAASAVGRMIADMGIGTQVILKARMGPDTQKIMGVAEFAGATFMPILRLPQDERYLSPEMRVSEVLFDDVDTLVELQRVSGDRLAVWANTLASVSNAGLVDAVAQEDPEAVWGVLVRSGVDIIQTDTPERAMEYLGSIER